jgi:hypothetical protein
MDTQKQLNQAALARPVFERACEPEAATARRINFREGGGVGTKSESDKLTVPVANFPLRGVRDPFCPSLFGMFRSYIRLFLALIFALYDLCSF